MIYTDLFDFGFCQTREKGAVTVSHRKTWSSCSSNTQEAQKGFLKVFKLRLLRFWSTFLYPEVRGPLVTAPCTLEGSLSRKLAT